MKSPLRGLEMALPPHYQHLVMELVRAEKPDVVVETGVESGWGAEYILTGLDANEKGHLYSIDHMVQQGFRDNPISHPRFTWIEKPAQDALDSLFDEVGPIDIFIHDSDHSFKHQTFEYEWALKHVRPGGIIVTDDPFCIEEGEWHHAWFKFLERHGFKDTDSQKGKYVIMGNAHWIRV